MKQRQRGPLLIDLDGPELTSEERELLAHPLVGGIVLFTRNLAERDQLVALCREVKRLHGRDLVIAVDHEGGRVQRFRTHGFTHLPPAARLGEAFGDDAEAALAFARRIGWLLAYELRAVGVEISFAPVVDCAHEGSTVLGDRCFSEDPAIISRFAHQVLEGMHAGGVVGCLKHFPGHGGVSEDSHLELPRDDRDLDTLLRRDLLPYARLKDAEAVMTAHVLFPRIDPSLPCFSRYWLNDILRRKLGFDGLVVSDDLTMAGARNIEPRAEDRVSRALAAGCDIVLLLNDRAAVVAALDGVRGAAAVPDVRWRRWAMPLTRAARMSDFETVADIHPAGVADEIARFLYPAS